MVELFGYNPVVETDTADPGSQILEILRDFESYLPLIDRNFSVISQNHTWAKRWDRMAQVLFP